MDKVDISPSRSEMSDDFISLSDFNSLSDSVLDIRQEQGDRSWQLSANANLAKNFFVRNIVAIFATNSSFLRVIANLQN